MSDVIVNDNEIAELESLHELSFDNFETVVAKRANTLEVSKARQAWYKRHTMDFGKNGRYTVVREVFSNDVPEGYTTAYFIQMAIVDAITGKIAYRPSGLYLVGVRENGAMVILSNSGKRLTSWDIDKRELSFNIVEKCQRLAHLFGISHRDIYANTVRDAQTTRKPSEK